MQKNYPVNIGDIEEHISCKILESSLYICSFSINNQIKLGIFEFGYKKIFNNYKFEKILEQNIDLFSTHNHAILNDIPEKYDKILCAKNKNSNWIECCYIITPNLDWLNIILNRPSFQVGKLNYYYESLSFKIDNCYFTGFYSEYLFCCGEENYINCYRINEKFELINQFQIKMVGKNSYLTIINNKDYASLFYMNENEFDKNTYEYIIYPPNCTNISDEILYIFINIFNKFF